MKLKEIDYQKIQELIDSKSKEIFINIFNEYFRYISNDKGKVRDLEDKEKMQLDEENNLVSVGKIIVVNRLDEDNPDFDKISENVPAGHGGRHKRDNLIHIYPFSKALDYILTLDEMIRTLINEIVVHEIFHFYVKPDIYKGIDKEDDVDKVFKDSLTEGIIQSLTNIYMKKYGLGEPQTGYGQEILLVNDIISDLQSQNYTKEQIMYFLFNDDYKELIGRCKNGENIKNNYLIRSFLFKYIKGKLKEIFRDNEEMKKKIIFEFANIANIDEMYNQYVELISVNGFDTAYLEEIDSIFKMNKEKIKLK